MGQTLCLLASYFPVRVTVKIEVLMLKLAYKYPVIVISEFRCYFFDGLKGKPVASTTLFSKGGDTKDKPISMFRSVVAVVPTSKAKAFCVRPVVRRFVLTALPISFRNAWVTCTPLCIMSSGMFLGVTITGASTDGVSVNAVVCLFCLEG